VGQVPFFNIRQNVEKRDLTPPSTISGGIAENGRKLRVFEMGRIS